MEDFDLSKLPKALSAEERAVLGEPFSNNSLTHAGARHAAGNRALALIDALTAALAEAVARMTVAESEVDRLRGNPDIDFPDSPPAETDRQAAVRWYKRADAAEARVRELGSELEQARANAAHLEDSRAGASQDAEIELAARDAAEQKLAAANALLSQWYSAYQGYPTNLLARTRDHLAAQPPRSPSVARECEAIPTAPSRTEAERRADHEAKVRALGLPVSLSGLTGFTIGDSRIEAAYKARTEAEQAVLRVVQNVPAELREAWKMPHAIVGWYHDFGKAVETYLGEKGIVSEKAGGGYGTAKVLDRAATLHAVQEQIQETLVESAGRHVCDRQDVYARGFLAINRIVEGK